MLPWPEKRLAEERLHWSFLCDPGVCFSEPSGVFSLPRRGRAFRGVDGIVASNSEMWA
jgi:hypothetical protein